MVVFIAQGKIIFPNYCKARFVIFSNNYYWIWTPKFDVPKIDIPMYILTEINY